MKYLFSSFDNIAAAHGAMCIVVSKDYLKDSIDSSNSNFYGIGVCKNPTEEVFVFPTSKGALPFNKEGKGTSFISEDKILKLLTNIEDSGVGQPDIISRLNNLNHSAEDIYNILKEVKSIVENVEAVIIYTDNK